MDNSKLNQNDILIAEFNYAMNTAAQANEDRVKVFQFVVANILTVAATLFVSFFTQSVTSSIFGLIFIFFVILGVFSLFQLSRLRLAWIESVKAMNKIKDYYIEQNKNLSNAFLWRTETIPASNKKMSLAYQLALTIIFLNSLSLAVAFSLLIERNLTLSLLVGLAGFLLHIIIWERALKK